MSKERGKWVRMPAPKFGYTYGPKTTKWNGHFDDGRPYTMTIVEGTIGIVGYEPGPSRMWFPDPPTETEQLWDDFRSSGLARLFCVLVVLLLIGAML